MAKRDRTPEASADEDFLHRWSRRKAKARREDAEPAPVAGEGKVLGPSEQGGEPGTIDPADLPDIESLTRGSDFKVFMQKGVPAHLRTLALRKLWRLNPALANLDGLIDYGEDFTDAARVVPDLKSAYEAGKGFAKRVEKVEKVIDDDASMPPQEPEAQAASPQENEPAPARESEVEPATLRSPEKPATTSERHRRARPPSRRPLPRRG